MSDAETLVEVEHLTRRFPKCEALADLSFRAGRGEVLGILGPNGSGKTTLLRVLATFLAPTSGCVRVAGFDAARNPFELRRKIGYLPESVPLYPEMRVEEYLHFRGRLRGLRKPHLAQRVRETIDQCGLADVARRPIGILSRGFRQRTGFADCLLHRPDILLLDEPMAGLDPAQAQIVRTLIQETGRQGVVLFSTHILAGVEETCRRVLILNAGRLAALDSPARLIQAASRLHAELLAPADALEQALGQLSQAHDIRIQSLPDGWSAASLRTGPEDLRSAVEQLAAAHHWPLRNLRHAGRSFEETILRLTTLPPKVQNPRTRNPA